MRKSETAAVDWRRVVFIFGLGAFFLCGLCSTVSGTLGWMTGYDLGVREAETRLLPPAGVLVTRVEADSPAARAGIPRGAVITALDEMPIGDIPAFHDQLSRYAPNDEITVAFVVDNNDEQVTTVQLGSVTRDGSEEAYLGIYYTARADSPADA